MKKLFTFLGWVFGIGILLLFVTLVGSFVVLLRGDVLDETSLQIETKHAVGVVDLTGEIVSSQGFIEKLEKLVDNDKIKAIVVRIDSPGGAVGASEEIYQAIKDADSIKPVTCAMSSIAASGGLYSSLGCRKVFTNKGTLTGSIGVVMMMPNFSGIMQKAGFEMTVIKSGKYKDAGSPFRAVTPEDRELMQGIIDTAYGQFVQAVADARKLSIEDVKKFADGRIIVGEEAVKLGLVDAVGNLEAAAKAALEFAGDPSVPEVIRPKKKKGLAAFLDGMGESILPSWTQGSSEVRLLYQAFL